jgi:hypothetical protein
MAKKRGSSKLSQAFTDSHHEISEDAAEHLIAEAFKKIREIKREQVQDERLTAAQSIVKDLKAGYTSAISYEKAKIDYLMDRIEEIQAGEVNPHSSAN